MKKTLILVIALTLSIAFYGCSDKEQNSQADTGKPESSTQISENSQQIQVQKYGDPNDSDNSWTVTESEKCRKIENFISDELPQIDEVTDFDSDKINNGTEMYTLTDTDKNEISIRKITGNVYNFSINGKYYELPQEKINELIELIQK